MTAGLANNPGGATLGGTLSVTASQGVASFAGLTLTGAAAGYTLLISSSGLSGATTGSITVSPGALATLSLADGAARGRDCGGWVRSVGGRRRRVRQSDGFQRRCDGGDRERTGRCWTGWADECDRRRGRRDVRRADTHRGGRLYIPGLGRHVSRCDDGHDHRHTRCAGPACHDSRAAWEHQRGEHLSAWPSWPKINMETRPHPSKAM